MHADGVSILSHPFRLTQTGAVATVDEGTTAANAEAIAVLVLTRRGERKFAPDFGITDPTFGELDAAEVDAGLSLWGPDGVSVESVEVNARDDLTADVVIRFDEDEE